MKKQNAILIFLFCGSLFFVSFVYGYKMMGNKVNKKPMPIGEKQEKRYEEDLSELEILKDEERISPNTFIEKKIYYNQCKHSITNISNAEDDIVNMTEEQFRKYMMENYSNVKIISFSIKEIVLREERDHLCPNHYIIGESDGKIAIYGIDEKGEKYLNKVFKDYSIFLLKEADQQKLKAGIVVDSEEELSDVLENFIS